MTADAKNGRLPRPHSTVKRTRAGPLAKPIAHAIARQTDPKKGVARERAGRRSRRIQRPTEHQLNDEQPEPNHRQSSRRLHPAKYAARSTVTDDRESATTSRDLGEPNDRQFR